MLVSEGAARSAQSGPEIELSASAQTLGSNTGVTTPYDVDVAKLRGANVSSLKSEAKNPTKYLQNGQKIAMGSVGLEPTTPCV